MRRREYLVNVVDKVLKEYSKVYSPHKKLIHAISEDKILIYFFVILFIEVVLAELFLYLEKDHLSFLFFILYLVTIGISSYRHFSFIKDKHGSVEHLDNERKNQFISKLLELNIDVLNENHNILLDDLIKDKCQKISNKKQNRAALNQGLMLTILAYVLQFFQVDVPFLTYLIMLLLGLVFILFSSQLVLQELSPVSRLNHISELLKEIRLTEIYTLDTV